MPTLRRGFLPAEYREAAAGAGIVQSVFVEADVAEPEMLAEAQYVCAAAARGEAASIAAIVAAARPEADDFRLHLDRLAALGPIVKGVRRVLHTQPDGWGETPRFTENVRALAAYGFSFDLCLRARQLETARHLARACPQVTFILDHGGNPPIAGGEIGPWRRMIREIAQPDNVNCKISGLVTQAGRGRASTAHLRPYVEHCIECFGWGRVMFGSDWPVCTPHATLADWLATLRRIVAGETAEHHRQLFAATAARVYRLPAPPAAADGSPEPAVPAGARR